MQYIATAPTWFIWCQDSLSHDKKDDGQETVMMANFLRATIQVNLVTESTVNFTIILHDNINGLFIILYQMFIYGLKLESDCLRDELCDNKQPCISLGKIHKSSVLIVHPHQNLARLMRVQISKKKTAWLI